MGSDVAGIRCRAERRGNDYVLNGTKYWITNGGIADYMTVFATVDPAEKHKGICAFVVEREWEGVTSGRHIPKLGQRGVEHRGDQLQERAGAGGKRARRARQGLRPGHEDVSPGPGLSSGPSPWERPAPAMEFAIDYAKRRQAFGFRLKDFQATQFKIAEMYQKVETSRLLTWKSAWETDMGMDPTINASIAKFYSSEAAFQVASDALQVAGGYGYTKLFPFEKILRDLRLMMIYEGTSEIQRGIVAGHAMGAYRPVMPLLEDLPLLPDTGGNGDFESEMKGRTAWRCRMCGHIHYGDAPPDECPYCYFPKTAFKKVWPRE